jgi:hypothetical protein
MCCAEGRRSTRTTCGCWTQFFAVFFSTILVIKPLDPDCILIRIHFKCRIPDQNYWIDVLCRRSKEHKNDLWLLDPIFSCIFFFSFWSSQPWIRIGSGSGFALNAGSQSKTTALACCAEGRRSTRTTCGCWTPPAGPGGRFNPSASHQTQGQIFQEGIKEI